VKVFGQSAASDESEPSPGGVDLSALAAPQFIPGHEIVGSVVEVGNRAPTPMGARVVLDPVIRCAARGIDPCEHCLSGRLGLCLSQSSGILADGKGIGFCSNVGGGWGEQVLAHPSMIHYVPPEVSDKTALLAEPLSAALNGIHSIPGNETAETALVIGGGPLGILSIHALRRKLALSFVVASVRHEYLAKVAYLMGADVALALRGGDLLTAVVDCLGAHTLGKGDRQMLWDGFDIVIDAVGNPEALNTAFRVVNVGGTVVSLGTPGVVVLDLRPLWLKQARLVSCLEHRLFPETQTPGGDTPQHTMAEAMTLLRSVPEIGDQIVSHIFSLEQFRQAMSVAAHRARHCAVKVALSPSRSAAKGRQRAMEIDPV